MQIKKNKYEKNANKKGYIKKGNYKNVPLLYLAWPGLVVLPRLYPTQAPDGWAASKKTTHSTWADASPRKCSSSRQENIFLGCKQLLQ